MIRQFFFATVVYFVSQHIVNECQGSLYDYSYVYYSPQAQPICSVLAARDYIHN